MSKSRNYCWTLNNPESTEFANIAAIFDFPAKVKYLCFGVEVGANGTQHLQGYVDFASPRALGRVTKSGKATGLKAIHPRIHWEVRKGTWDQAVDYCKKDGIFFEGGEPNEQGKRGDIEDVREVVAKGGHMWDILQATNSYQAIKIGELLLKHKPVWRTQKTEVWWIHGPTGVGKTHWVESQVGLNPYQTWWSPNMFPWWTGYESQENVVLDEFRGTIPLSTMLLLCNHQPMHVEVKGSTRPFAAKRMFIMAPYSPEETYKNAKGSEDLYQLVRRIEHNVHFPHRGFDMSAYAITTNFGTEVPEQKSGVILEASPHPDNNNSEVAEFVF